MNETIEHLTEVFAARKATARIWLEARDDHDRERMIAHLKFVEYSKEADEALAALIAAQGEPS